MLGISAAHGRERIPRFPPSDVTNSRLAAPGRQLVQTEADQRLDRTVAVGVVICTRRVAHQGPTGATAWGHARYEDSAPCRHTRCSSRWTTGRSSRMPFVALAEYDATGSLPSSVAGGIRGAESSVLGSGERLAPRAFQRTRNGTGRVEEALYCRSWRSLNTIPCASSRRRALRSGVRVQHKKSAPSECRGAN